MSDNVFHNHLDVCAQCRNNPMLLCPEGSRQLHHQVTGADPGVQPQRMPETDPMAAFDSMFSAIFGKAPV
jgi:hypothetical protein